MIKKKIFFIEFILAMLFSTVLFGQGIIIDHNCTNINDIPESAIIQAKSNLHIAYGHTSHGSQLTEGMRDLDAFMGGTGLYKWHDGPQAGALDIDDRFAGGDLGHNGSLTWAASTRTYLDNSNNSDVNVIIWSWCGGVSDNTEAGIQTYLDEMNKLESEYPNIKFVYMTGHSYINRDEQTKTNNQQIRNYCIANNKILYDFEDIEYYDPDGNYFEFVTDNCNYYDSNEQNRTLLGNWATEWQNSHTEGVDWYNCSAAHSEPLNGNRKAYAAWWLWAKLAGWEGITSINNIREVPKQFGLNNNYPNPFNPTTNISFDIPRNSNVKLDIFNSIGQLVAQLIDNNYIPGSYATFWNGKNDFGTKVNSGIYFYRLTTDNFVQTKQMILMK